jgi:hypothetical protein
MLLTDDAAAARQSTTKLCRVSGELESLARTFGVPYRLQCALQQPVTSICQQLQHLRQDTQQTPATWSVLPEQPNLPIAARAACVMPPPTLAQAMHAAPPTSCPRETML